MYSSATGSPPLDHFSPKEKDPLSSDKKLEEKKVVPIPMRIRISSILSTSDEKGRVPLLSIRNRFNSILL